MRLERLRRPLHVEAAEKLVAYPVTTIARLAGLVARAFSRGAVPLVRLSPSGLIQHSSRSHEEHVAARSQAIARRSLREVSLAQSRRFHALLRQLALEMKVPSAYGGEPVFAPVKDVYAEACRQFKAECGLHYPLYVTNCFRIISSVRPEAERERAHRSNLTIVHQARAGSRRLSLFTDAQKDAIWEAHRGLIIFQCKRVLHTLPVQTVVLEVLPAIRPELYYHLDFFDPCKHRAAVFERKLLKAGVDAVEAAKRAAVEEKRLQETMPEWLPEDLLHDKGLTTFVGNYARFTALHETRRHASEGALNVSLDAPLEERPPGRARSLLDKLGVPDASRDAALDLRDAMDCLSLQERFVLERRYLREMTLEETGRALEKPVSRERVRQIEANAIAKLRKRILP